MSDAFSKLFGGPTQEEVLGLIRLGIWNEFEKINELFENPDHDFSEPEFLKGFLRGLILRVTAESNISDIIAHAPIDSFGATMYPKHEAIKIIREEMVRAALGDGQTND